MNNDIQTMLMITWVLMAISGIVAYRTFLLVKGIIEVRRRQKLYPHLEKVKYISAFESPTGICEIHDWDIAKLAMSPLPTGDYRVCTTCGFVSCDEGPYKLNAPALEVYRNNLKIRADRISLANEISRLKQQGLDLLMSKLVKGNLESFDGDIHKNGEALQQFFRKSIIEIDALYDKLNKELEGRRG